MRDLIIIGSGAAGLSAALYASRFGLNVLVISKELGGCIADSYCVENYLGIENISGEDLIDRFKKHCDSFNVNFEFEEVYSIDGEDGDFVVYTENGEYQTKKIILALGMKRLMLNVKGEREFMGRGITFCAVCDGSFFKNKKVFVVGGGDVAISTALIMKKYTNNVTLIVREPKFTAQPRMQVLGNNIDVLFNKEIIEFKGENKLKKVKLSDNNEIDVDGVFISVGSKPDEKLTTNLHLNVDEEGYVLVNPRMQTSRGGVYCAGDLSTGSNKLRQVSTAISEGTIAAHSVYEDLVSLKID